MFFIRTLISFIKDEEYRDLLITTLLIIGAGTLIYHYLDCFPFFIRGASFVFKVSALKGFTI